LVGLGEPNI